jgi:CheY-like chemotaxis protein
MGFVAETGSGHVIGMDGAPDPEKPEQSGQNLAARPMELLLAGAGGCTAYDVVLMDVQMPEMSGLEATALLREFEKEAGEDRPHQLVVGVSANNEGVMKTECLQAGMDFFTIKPFSLDQIMIYYKGSQGAQLPPK